MSQDSIRPVREPADHSSTTIDSLVRDKQTLKEIVRRKEAEVERLREALTFARGELHRALLERG
jgi:hypothetical protein